MPENPKARPIHTATFQQPGAELNPMGAVVPTPVNVEVYGDGVRVIKWRAREATRQVDFKQVGDQPSAIAARCAVARLFKRQPVPWHVDGVMEPDAGAIHIHHHDGAEPSLCGSLFHLSLSLPPDRIILLSKVRSGELKIPVAERKGLCAVCLAHVDRSPQPGDAVYHRLMQTQGTVVSLPERNENPPRYGIHFGREGTDARITAGEFDLVVMSELPRR